MSVKTPAKIGLHEALITPPTSKEHRTPANILTHQSSLLMFRHRSAGSTTAVEGECSAYKWCLGGVAFVQQCASGLLWNQDRQICDWPDNFKSPCEKGE